MQNSLAAARKKPLRESKSIQKIFLAYMGIGQGGAVHNLAATKITHHRAVQCRNLAIFLPLVFYVKTILGDLETQKLPFLTAEDLLANLYILPG